MPTATIRYRRSVTTRRERSKAYEWVSELMRCITKEDPLFLEHEVIAIWTTSDKALYLELNLALPAEWVAASGFELAP